MKSKVTFDSHPTEDMLEEYCFNRLPDGTTAAVEEHLLVCTSCQETLQNLDKFIRLIKAVARDYALTPSSKAGGSVNAAWNQARSVLIRLGVAWNTLWFGLD